MELNSDNIDINQLEKQRYDAIKKTGNYLELNILIGTDDETLDGGLCRIPVVTTTASHVGAKEMGFLYGILQEMCKFYEKEYPLECFMYKMGAKVQHLGFTQTRPEDKEE